MNNKHFTSTTLLFTIFYMLASLLHADDKNTKHSTLKKEHFSLSYFLEFSQDMRLYPPSNKSSKSNFLRISLESKDGSYLSTPPELGRNKSFKITELIDDTGKSLITKDAFGYSSYSNTGSRRYGSLYLSNIALPAPKAKKIKSLKGTFTVKKCAELKEIELKPLSAAIDKKIELDETYIKFTSFEKDYIEYESSSADIYNTGIDIDFFDSKNTPLSLSIDEVNNKMRITFNFDFRGQKVSSAKISYPANGKTVTVDFAFSDIPLQENNSNRQKVNLLKKSKFELTEISYEDDEDEEDVSLDVSLKLLTPKEIALAFKSSSIPYQRNNSIVISKALDNKGKELSHPNVYSWFYSSKKTKKTKDGFIAGKLHIYYLYKPSKGAKFISRLEGACQVVKFTGNKTTTLKNLQKKYDKEIKLSKDISMTIEKSADNALTIKFTPELTGRDTGNIFKFDFFDGNGNTVIANTNKPYTRRRRHSLLGVYYRRKNRSRNKYTNNFEFKTPLKNISKLKITHPTKAKFVTVPIKLKNIPLPKSTSKEENNRTVDSESYNISLSYVELQNIFTVSGSKSPLVATQNDLSIRLKLNTAYQKEKLVFKEKNAESITFIKTIVDDTGKVLNDSNKVESSCSYVGLVDISGLNLPAKNAKAIKLFEGYVNVYDGEGIKYIVPFKFENIPLSQENQ